MELGKVKTETGEIPPPKPQPRMAAAAAAAAVESMEAAAAAPPLTTNVLMRQTSIGSTTSKINTNTNTNCLCSPTTHAGSFRCRLHRVPSSSLQRTKSIDSDSVVAAAATPTTALPES